MTVPSLPTSLTWLRIGLIPVFILCFFWKFPAHNMVTAILFALAGITDWLDGYLARRWQQTSAFGAFLDPVADKLMVAAALVLIVQHDPNPFIAIAAIVIIGREIAISALREWMASLGVRHLVAVKMIGKLKTTMQIIALLLLLYRDPIQRFPTFLVGQWVLFLAAILTLWSMWEYLMAAWHALRGQTVSH